MKFQTITKLTFSALIACALHVSAVACSAKEMAADKKAGIVRKHQVKLQGTIITIPPTDAKSGKDGASQFITRPISIDFVNKTWSVGSASDVRKSGINNEEKNRSFQGKLSFDGCAIKGYHKVVLIENDNGRILKLTLGDITPGNIKNGMIFVSEDKEGGAIAKQFEKQIREGNQGIMSAYNKGKMTISGKVLERPLFVTLTPFK